MTIKWLHLTLVLSDLVNFVMSPMSIGFFCYFDRVFEC